MGLWVPGERRSAWAGPGHDGLPAPYAPLQGQRPAGAGAVAASLLLIKDLVVDRGAFDRIIQAGGYTLSVNVGGAPDGNTILIPGNVVEQAMDSAACIGCGACVAACKNASAALFTSAKISHLALCLRGKSNGNAGSSRWSTGTTPRIWQLLERGRVRGRLPEGHLDQQHRARMNREYLRATLL